MGKSTYDEELKNPEFRKLLEKERFMLEISETISRAMDEQHISIRELAQKAHVSKTVITGIRSGSRKNITLDKLKDLIDVLNLDLLVVAK